MSKECWEKFLTFWKENEEMLHNANITKSEAAFIFGAGWEARKKSEAFTRVG